MTAHEISALAILATALGIALYAITATITPRWDRMCAAMRGQSHTFMENAHVEL